jgi:hypothetical protein
MKPWLGLAFIAACGRAPEAARPVAEEFVEVEYPPPPAQIEEREPNLAGRPDCSWLDGHYEWRGRRWQWQAGKWIVAPRSCAYAPPTVSFGRPPNARLYYTPPRWYPLSGKGPCDAVVACIPENRSER